MSKSIRAVPVPFALAAIIALAAVACAASSTAPPGTREPGEIPENALRILFIGNSLTYWNDLPQVVAAMAVATGQEQPPYVEMIAAPDYSLEDHWNDGRARDAIRGGTWDYVVMQQGPSSLPQNRLHLREWAGRFAVPIRTAGAVPALYMVWPSQSRYGDFDGVLAAYEGAAEAVDGLFLPAGQAWRNAWARDASLPLYGPDAFHPSTLGTWLAALVIFAGVYEASPDDVPNTLQGEGVSISVPPATAAILRTAALEVLANWPAR